MKGKKGMKFRNIIQDRKTKALIAFSWIIIVVIVFITTENYRLIGWGIGSEIVNDALLIGVGILVILVVLKNSN